MRVAVGPLTIESKEQELRNRQPCLVQNLPKSSGPYLLVVRNNNTGLGVARLRIMWLPLCR